MCGARLLIGWGESFWRVDLLVLRALVDLDARVGSWGRQGRIWR